MEELWAFNEEIVARSIYASEIPVISAVGHETDFTISDFAADRRAETPTAAAHMAVPDINELKVYVGDLKENLHNYMLRLLQLKEYHLNTLDFNAFRRDIESRIVMEQLRSDNMNNENKLLINNLIESYEQQILNLKNSLDALDPKSIMKRGYSAVTDKDGRFINSVNSLKPDDKVVIYMQDGSADCTVDYVRGD